MSDKCLGKVSVLDSETAGESVFWWLGKAGWSWRVGFYGFIAANKRLRVELDNLTNAISISEN